jgi:hypothetical protein
MVASACSQWVPAVACRGEAAVGRSLVADWDLEVHVSRPNEVIREAWATAAYTEAGEAIVESATEAKHQPGAFLRGFTEVPAKGESSEAATDDMTPRYPWDPQN